MLLPSALLALIAAVVPYLVHRIGKRHPTPVRFAAMQLLLRAERRVRSRQKIRELLLLIARTSIAAALPLIFARPFVEQASDAPLAALNTQSAVLLLDDSASMRRTVDGTMLWERARDRARAVLRQLPTGSAVALVTASENSTAPVGELTMEKSRALSALDDMSCSAKAADFASAMRRAAVILGGAVHKERRIFLFTDLQDAGWDAGNGLPEIDPPDVAVIDVADGRGDGSSGAHEGSTNGWYNRAVIAVDAVPEPDLGPGSIAVTADIMDWGSSARGSLGVKLVIDGRPITKGFVDVPAGGRTRKRFVHAMGPDERGLHQVVVEIDGDDFALDDIRRASLPLTQALRVLIVNGDARTERTEDETFFLESALTSAGSGTSVTTVLPDDLTDQDLSRFDVVFLTNAAAPSQAMADALIEFVSLGGGVFISVGDRVDADTWNQRLGALLPQPLGLVRTAAIRQTGTAGETKDDRPAERFAPIDRQHPILAAFPARDDGLGMARFFKYNLLEPVPEDDGRTVILRFESGAPALVERAIAFGGGVDGPGGSGSHTGRVMLLATTIDREWSDLPIRPGFLPLMAEITRWLAGAVRAGHGNSLLVGQARTFTLNGEERRLEVSQPGGKVWVIHRRPGKDPKNVVFKGTDEPGVYRVSIANADNTPVERPDETFVVNVDPRESTTARLPPDRRPDRNRDVEKGEDRPTQRSPLWHGLATLLIILILAESLLAMRRRSVMTSGANL